MQIVTGYRGQAHITSNDDQGRNQGVFGQNSYVLSVGSQFAPTLVSANELRIADGEAVMQGVHFRVDPSSFDSVTITNGTQGMNRKDLVVCRYTKDGSTGVENCEWVVIEGTPTSGTAARPSAVSGDILDGALVADMPFFEIVLSGINVTAVNSLFSKLMTMQEIQALAKTNESGISELNSSLDSISVGFIGEYAATSYTLEQACKAVWDALPNTGTTTMGYFGNSGKVMFMANRYDSGANGMMQVMRVFSNAIGTLKVVSGVKTFKTIDPDTIDALNSKITTYNTITSTTHTINGRYMKLGYLVVAHGDFRYKSGSYNVETNLPMPIMTAAFIIRNANNGSLGTAYFEAGRISTYLTTATLNDGDLVRFSFSYISSQA